MNNCSNKITTLTITISIQKRKKLAKVTENKKPKRGEMVIINEFNLINFITERNIKKRASKL